MVVMLRENERSQPALRAPGFNRLVVSHQTIDGILESVDTLGRAFGAEDKAQEMLADIRTRIRRVEEKTAGRDRPRVMVAIYRTAGRGRLEDVSVAGADGYFDRMIAMAGGRNACRESTVRFPIVASEGVLWMNPDVIIDIVPPRDERKIDEQTMLADWQQVAEVAAVRNGRVHVLDDDFAYVPGPRFIVLVERLARVLHPEVDWRDGDPK
jgi:iron complex transport system substrate-binding protein